eukprot:TRINITY_DN3562_c0_g2_i1.p1 TRINITY_DN3562_c0_g2~~TRINITY_DN3562_c0_g2_i1.p1  ORF type:complete len:642 (+),score=194.84 TRINITY_DN3562_c0_g2_i1:113-2038(+)
MATEGFQEEVDLDEEAQQADEPQAVALDQGEEDQADEEQAEEDPVEEEQAEGEQGEEEQEDGEDKAEDDNDAGPAQGDAEGGEGRDIEGEEDEGEGVDEEHGGATAVVTEEEEGDAEDGGEEAMEAMDGTGPEAEAGHDEAGEDEAMEGSEEPGIELDGKPEDALPDEDGEGTDDATEGKGSEMEDEQKLDTSNANGLEKKADFVDPIDRPPHGSEVFIGGIPRESETIAADVEELCSPIGKIFEIRIMRDPKEAAGTNKGYAFVTFTCKEDAEKAIETLKDVEIKGKKVRVSHSQPKSRLFVGNVPKAWEKDELKAALLEQGAGITSVELLQDPKVPTRNRGFAFVEYYNHACADVARRNMSKPQFLLGGYPPTISWADPRPEPDASAMSSVKVVYVKGLPEDTTEDELREALSVHGEVTRVLLPAPKPGMPPRDFGFVHFADRSMALKACEAAKTELRGKPLEVSLAKPQLDRRDRPSPHHDGPPYAYPPGRGGLLPQYSERGGGGGRYAPSASRGDGGPYGSYYGGGASGDYSSGGAYGSYSRGGYDRPSSSPLIYGRAAPPAGMSMVPMLLPDGRVGYVLQPAGRAEREPVYRERRSRGRSEVSPEGDSYYEGRAGGGGGSSREGGGGGGGRRYRPY